MKTEAQLLLILVAAFFIPSALAKKRDAPPFPTAILNAGSVYVDCVCPRALASASPEATDQLLEWGRFQIVPRPKDADLILLFSGNPYLGDYLTRDGPDTRPVRIESTIMTVIDAHTGAALWTDYRRWGSWRVKGATKDLIQELREKMEEQIKRWTLDDIMQCSVTPVYAGLAHVTSEQALQRTDFGVNRIDSTRLTLSSSMAPGFCTRANLIVGSDDKITAFEVQPPQSEILDVNEVLQHADRFDFTSGRSENGGRVYFSAESKDKRVLIRFDVRNHRSILSSVKYFY